MGETKLVGLIAALWLGTATTVAPAHASSPARPIHLVTAVSGTGMRVKLVGASPVQCDASYVLEVWNGSTAGSNRSVQRGAARIRPGIETNIVTMNLAGTDPQRWAVRLRVVPCGTSVPYEETRGQLR